MHADWADERSAAADLRLFAGASEAIAINYIVKSQYLASTFVKRLQPKWLSLLECCTRTKIHSRKRQTQNRSLQGTV
eukprot:6481386-Amphidinium_carterae.1